MPWDFWDITPAELNILLEADYENKLYEAKNRIIQAYYTASLQRCKKMPKLQNILKDMDKKDKKPMTANQMLDVVKQLNAAFGGEEIVNR